MPKINGPGSPPLRGPCGEIALYRDSGYPLERDDLYVSSGQKEVVFLEMTSCASRPGPGPRSGSYGDPLKEEMEAWEMLSMETWVREEEEEDNGERVPERDGP